MVPERIALSVEDSADDRFILDQAFRRAGFPNALRTVVDGEEAVAYLSGEGPYGDRRRYALPQIILLDLKLPKKSGFEVLEWCRASPEHRRTPVIALTSSAQPADIRRAYESGATSYLVKPTGFEEIMVLVKALVSYWFVFNRFS